MVMSIEKHCHAASRKQWEEFGIAFKGIGTRSFPYEPDVWCRMRDLHQWLQRLYLYDTDVTDEHFLHLTALPTLVRLELHSSKISDDGLSCFVRMPALGSLTLATARVTDEGVERTTRRLPNCDVSFIRQLEASATHLVVPWVDGGMDNAELWEFLRSNLLEGILVLGDVVDRTITSFDPSSYVATHDDRWFTRSWAPLRQCLAGLRSRDQSIYDFGAYTVTFLVAVMILRQLTDSAILNPGHCQLTRFVPSSTNVSEQFLNLALQKLGRQPFGISRMAYLHELAEGMASNIKKELDQAHLNSQS